VVEVAIRILTFPGTPVCIPSDYNAVDEGADQANFCLCGVSDGRRRGRKSLPGWNSMFATMRRGFDQLFAR
jgi:hypothetical protein